MCGELIDAENLLLCTVLGTSSALSSISPNAWQSDGRLTVIAIARFRRLPAKLNCYGCAALGGRCRPMASERTQAVTSRFGLSWRDLLLAALGAIATIVAGGLTISAHAQQVSTQVPAEIVHNWGWFLFFGIGLLVLGIVAIVRSVAATVISMLFFGWLLLIAAGIEVVQTVMAGRET